MAHNGHRLQYNAPVTLTFFFVSLAALLLGFATGNTTTAVFFSVYRCPPSLLAVVRLFTHVLGHAGWEHFLSNMLLFLVVAPPMEEKYGSSLLLKGILFTAFVSGVLQCLFFPSSALLGASGIVFMLIMLSSLSGMEAGRVPLTLVLVAALYLGQQVYDMIFVEDNVANFMHIIGGLCGTGFGVAMLPRERY